VDGKTERAAVRRGPVALLVLVLAAGLFLLAAVPGNAPRASATRSNVGADGSGEVGPDFNGDGFADLAVGVPGESVTVGGRNIEAAGAVHVIYGSATGLNGDTPLDDEVWHQNRFSGFVTTPESGDSFGYALAAGDFNGDGVDDLAVGAPGEDVNYQGHSIPDAGEVDLLRGSRTGLAATIVAVREGRPPVGSVPQEADYFGFSLAAGNVGLHPSDDLIIGVPYEDWTDSGAFDPAPAVKDAGAVVVLWGSDEPEKWFLASSYYSQEWGWSWAGYIADHSEPGDRFGFSVLAADVGKSPKDELVIGVPYEDVGPIKDAGAVHVLFSKYDGSALLYDEGNRFWQQDSRNIPGKAEPEDHFGWALAGGDFGLDRTGDLAIGVPDENVGDHPNAGAVNILYGSSTGPTSWGAQLWHQGSTSVQGDPEGFDQFGYALSAGDFGFAALADLAVGVPGEQLGGAGAAGAVNILMGTTLGLSPSNNLFESQNNSGFDGAVEGDSESGDWFGWSLTAGNYGRGPGIDLAVGVPGEGKESLFSIKQKVGAVNVLYSDQNGLRANDDQFWWQASDSLHDSAEETDQFGKALAR
jgi:FG-GAP repeat